MQKNVLQEGKKMNNYIGKFIKLKDSENELNLIIVPNTLVKSKEFPFKKNEKIKIYISSYLSDDKEGRINKRSLGISADKIL